MAGHGIDTTELLITFLFMQFVFVEEISPGNIFAQQVADATETFSRNLSKINVRSLRRKAGQSGGGELIANFIIHGIIILLQKRI